MEEEERIRAAQQEKERRLRQFQEDVKQRVQRLEQTRRQIQLQNSAKAVCEITTFEYLVIISRASVI